MSLTSLGHTVGTGRSHPERTGCCPCPPPAFREPENRAAGAAWRDPGGAQSWGTNPGGLRATGETGRPLRRWVVRIYWVTEANCRNASTDLLSSLLQNQRKESAGIEGGRGRLLAGPGGNFCTAITAASPAGEPRVRSRAAARCSCQHLSAVSSRYLLLGFQESDQRRSRAWPRCPQSSPNLCRLRGAAGPARAQGRAVSFPTTTVPEHWKTRTCPNQPPDKAPASCWDLDTSFATAPQFPVA